MDGEEATIRTAESRDILAITRIYGYYVRETVISFEIEAPLSAKLSFDVNGQRYDHTLSELLQAGRSHYLNGWLSEAIRIGPLVPLQQCIVEAEVRDEPEENIDIYQLQVAQHNGQWAWLTPIWVER